MARVIMKKMVINKDKCAEVSLVMKGFTFEHPGSKRKPQDLEKELFYFFIVVGICHQINWNFLLDALKKVQKRCPSKFTPSYLEGISDKEIFDWLSAYPKKWRLGKRFKRGELVRGISRVLVRRYKGKVENLLKVSKHKMGGKKGLYALLKDFEAYGEDPLSKKSAVLIDLLDRFHLYSFSDWQSYIPPVDYHITRIALRNGVVVIKDKQLLKKLENNLAILQEEDVIVRSAVIEALKEIARVSKKHPKDLQGFYWVIGRECCDPHRPRCDSCGISRCSVATYMKIDCKKRCPLALACEAVKNKELLKIKEPNFITTFY